MQTKMTAQVACHHPVKLESFFVGPDVPQQSRIFDCHVPSTNKLSTTILSAGYLTCLHLPFGLNCGVGGQEYVLRELLRLLVTIFPASGV